MKTRCVSCDYRNKGICVLTNLSMVLDDPCALINMPEAIRKGIVDKHTDMLTRAILEVNDIKTKLDFINEYVEKAKERPLISADRPNDYFKVNDEIVVLCNGKWNTVIVRAKTGNNIIYVVDGVEHSTNIHSPILIAKKDCDYFAKNPTAFDSWYADGVKKFNNTWVN